MLVEPMLEDLVIAPAKNDFTYFVKLVLKQKLGEMHKEWIEDITKSNKHLCIISARGHFKTTIMSVAFPLWVMFREEEPKTFIIVSATQDQAGEIMGLIKKHIEENPILHSVLYPDSIHQTKWSESQIRTRKGHRVISSPLSDSIRGKHSNYTICDDILKAEISTDIMDAKRVFYGTVFPTVHAKRGKHIVVGTPIAYTDLLHDLATKETFKTLKYPAIKLGPDGSWKEPMFPEHFTLDQLREIYQTMPRHLWAREYLCEPLSDEVSMFPSDLLRAARMAYERSKAIYDIPAKLPDGSPNPAYHEPTRVLGCDIAVSESSQADWSVFTVLEKLEGQPVFIREIRRQHLTSSMNVEEIEKMNELYNFSRILVERTGVGWTVAEEVANSDKTRGVTTTFDTKKASKERILSRLEVMLRNNTIPEKQDSGLAIPENDILLQELSSFGYKKEPRSGVVTYASLGAHDDCIMSLAIALEAWELSLPISLAYV